MMTDSEWTAQQDAERRLYEKYGKPLETDHAGEFIAIGMDGEILLGKRDGETLRRAIDKFGRGNFAMARIGSDVMHEWSTVWQQTALFRFRRYESRYGDGKRRASRWSTLDSQAT